MIDDVKLLHIVALNAAIYLLFLATSVTIILLLVKALW